MKRATKKPAVGKVVRTHELKLTGEELVHLRDLFSVMLPSDLTMTVSQFLATTEGRQFHEIKLWNKVSKLCRSIGIPVEEGAPDYVIAPTGTTPLGVFRLQLSEDEEEAANAAQRTANSFLDERKLDDACEPLVKHPKKRGAKQP